MEEMINILEQRIANARQSHDVFSRNEVINILSDLLGQAKNLAPYKLKVNYYNIEEIEVAFSSLHMSEYMRLQKNVVVIDYDEAFKQMKINLEDEA